MIFNGYFNIWFSLAVTRVSRIIAVPLPREIHPCFSSSPVYLPARFDLPPVQLTAVNGTRAPALRHTGGRRKTKARGWRKKGYGRGAPRLIAPGAWISHPAMITFSLKQPPRQRSVQLPLLSTYLLRTSSSKSILRSSFVRVTIES